MTVPLVFSVALVEPKYDDDVAVVEEEEGVGGK